MAWQLGVWFHRTAKKDRAFRRSRFAPRPERKAETAALAAEVKRLREEVAVQQTAAEAARVGGERDEGPPSHAPARRARVPF
jgi:type I restriction enzyme R subunit